MKALIRYFIDHRTAPNIAMIIGIGVGIVSLFFLNVQLWPETKNRSIRINIMWSGATAGDADQAIGQRLEMKLNKMSNAKRVTVYSVTHRTAAYIILRKDADPREALDEAKRLVSEITGLPSGVKPASVTLDNVTLPVATLLVSGPFTYEAGVNLGNQLEKRFKDAGVREVGVGGAVSPGLVVSIDAEKVQSVGISMELIHETISQALTAYPTGSIHIKGIKQSSRMVSNISIAGLLKISLPTNAGPVALGSTAKIRKEKFEGDIKELFPKGNGFFLSFYRGQDEHLLDVTRKIRQTLAQLRNELPETITLQLHDVKGDQIRDRINLLLKNGVIGLILVGISLFIFLNIRAAFWVLLGIPTAMAMSLSLMWLSGQNINMISVFAMIILLGIIVDDAIVVADNITTHHKTDPSRNGTYEATIYVLRPILTATLTTITAFLPIAYLTDSLGQYVRAIPVYACIALIASFLECFFLLPGHMRTASGSKTNIAASPKTIREQLNRFLKRKLGLWFRVVIGRSYKLRYIALLVCVLFIAATTILLASNKLRFQFWQNPETNIILADITMVPGAGKEALHNALFSLWRALERAEKSLGYNYKLIKATYGITGMHFASRTQNFGSGIGAINVEIADNKGQRLPTTEFIKLWRQFIEPIPDLGSLEITTEKVGPRGADIHIILNAENVAKLQAGVNEVEQALRDMDGVYDIRNNFNQGKKQLEFTLTKHGQELGFTNLDIAQAVHTYLSGKKTAQVIYNGQMRNISIRLDTNKLGLQAALAALEFKDKQGNAFSFFEIAKVKTGRGEIMLIRRNGKLSIRVLASIDRQKINAKAIWKELNQNILPAIASRNDVSFGFSGKRREAKQAFNEISVALVLGLLAIYLILAWSMENYLSPFIVLLVMPLGGGGALLGHYLLGFKITVFSVIAFLALSGVLVNDSYILLEEIKRQKQKGLSLMKATINGYSARLRAVFLTTFTTVVGLAPLIIEPGYQAQFLKPFAITFSWGLAAATVFSFLLIPALLAIGEDLIKIKSRLFGKN